MFKSKWNRSAWFTGPPADPPSCEMLLLVPWKDGDRHMETHRLFPCAKEAWPRDLNNSLRIQSHLTLVRRAQMTKELSTLPNIRQQSTVRQHFYFNFLSLTAALWTNTLKSMSNPATTISCVLKNYHKHARGCYRGPSCINSCSPFLSFPQVCFENIGTSLPPPFDSAYIYGVCAG